MEKILFWLLNIIISSNCIYFIFFKLFLASWIQDLDPFKEYFFEPLLMILSYILYILFKLFLFYIKPVKNLKYFNEMYSDIVHSNMFIFKIFFMDIIIAIIEIIIMLIINDFDVMLIFKIPILHCLLLGGILPSYLIYMLGHDNKRVN